MEATRKLRSGGPLPGGDAPVAAVDSRGSLKHKADEEDVRGKLVQRKRGLEARLTERQAQLWQDGAAFDVRNRCSALAR
jgi:hypothetical protein